MSKNLSLALIALCCVFYRIEASPKETVNKFLSEEIFPDILDELPDIKPLKVVYPNNRKVSLGNILTPTQVKSEPRVEWEAEEDVFYTLLMTGERKSVSNCFSLCNEYVSYKRPRCSFKKRANKKRIPTLADRQHSRQRREQRRLCVPIHWLGTP